jgi:hypothetical protein
MFSGSVKTTKTQVILYANIVNVVGPLDPSSSTLFTGSASLAAALGDDFTGSLNNFSTNGQLSISGTYYSDGSQILDGSYSPLDPGALDAIPRNRGVIVSVIADRIWLVNSPMP